MKNTTIILFLLLATTFTQAQTSNKDSSMFPPAKKGYVKKVIHFKKKSNENQYKIELILGKTLLVDCNHLYQQDKDLNKP